MNLALALTRNVVLKQDYDLSRDLRAKLHRIMDLNLQLRPQLEGEDFREAMRALDEVSEQYSDDPVLMEIIADSTGICTRLASGIPTAPPPQETLPPITLPTSSP